MFFTGPDPVAIFFNRLSALCDEERLRGNQKTGADGKLERDIDSGSRATRSDHMHEAAGSGPAVSHFEIS